MFNKIICDHCHKIIWPRIIWPKTAKMSVTPHDPKEGGKKKTYHFKCWMQIATKEQIYEISKEFQKHKNKGNLNNE